jgi:alpha-1,6-mannosyltransferase
MKTMHITNSWSETSGGVATFYRALMDAANRHRHSMCLIVPAKEDAEETYGAHVTLYKVASPKARLNSNYRIMYPDKYLWSGGRIRKILQREAPDLVEISDKYTLNYLGPLLRLRLMNDIRFRPAVIGLSFERMDVNFRSYLFGGNWGCAFSAWYMRYLYFPFFDHHIAISDQTAQELCRAGKGHEVARGVFQLPLGVDCTVFSPKWRSVTSRCRILAAAGANEEDIILLYAGRMVPEKNLSLLIDTMEQLESAGIACRLVLAGDGISRDAFLSEARKRLGNRVSWLGHIGNRDALAELYANCDFFLHPNPHEPFGIAPLEAMASGIPLIAPDAGGVKAYANASNAVLTVPVGSAFAAAIRNLVREEGKRREIIQAALMTAQEFSLETATDRYLDFYMTMCCVLRSQLKLEEANPLFISQPPSPLRARVLRSIAQLAASAYRAWPHPGISPRRVEEVGN